MKYTPLKDYLIRQTSTEVPMTFADIERTIGGSLPQSASKYPAWWSNNPSNNVMTRVWLEAGYKTERVDLASRRLVFKRARQPVDAAPAASPSQGEGDPLAGLYGILRGTVRVADGVDLTQPTGEIWGAEEA